MKEKSCGAIVFNDNKVLLVESLEGVWGFPKGHVEANESEKMTALREVKEETNQDIMIVSDKRFEIAYKVKETIDKTVVYFIAKKASDAPLIAQMEELKQVAFVDKNEVAKYLSYDNLKKLWQEVLDYIKDNNISL